MNGRQQLIKKLEELTDDRNFVVEIRGSQGAVGYVFQMNVSDGVEVFSIYRADAGSNGWSEDSADAAWLVDQFLTRFDLSPVDLRSTKKAVIT